MAICTQYDFSCSRLDNVCATTDVTCIREDSTCYTEDDTCIKVDDNCHNLDYTCIKQDNACTNVDPNEDENQICSIVDDGDAFECGLVDDSEALCYSSDVCYAPDTILPREPDEDQPFVSECFMGDEHGSAPPRLKVDRTGSVNFGNVTLGSTRTLNAVVIRNIGDSILNATVAIDDPNGVFAIEGDSSFKINKNNPISVKIKFTPIEDRGWPRTHKATMTILSATAVVMLTLQGKGVD